jgi:large subunit ribosomal protein L18e
MFSKTQLNKRIQRKNNPELVETLIACKKAGGDWMKVGKILSGSKRNLPSINLEEINEKSSEGDTIVVPGKVLSQGNIDSGFRFF